VLQPAAAREGEGCPQSAPLARPTRGHTMRRWGCIEAVLVFGGIAHVCASSSWLKWDLSLTASYKFAGAAAVSSSSVAVFAPYDGVDAVGLFDKETMAFSLVSLDPPREARAYMGAVANETKVYFIPHRQPNVGIFNVATNSFSVFAFTQPLVRWNDKWAGGAIVGHKIIFAPHNQDSVGVFTPR
jgi:hypothetical protein